MKKYFLGIFICFSAIFLMSHNTSAIAGIYHPTSVNIYSGTSIIYTRAFEANSIYYSAYTLSPTQSSTEFCFYDDDFPSSFDEDQYVNLSYTAYGYVSSASDVQSRTALFGGIGGAETFSVISSSVSLSDWRQTNSFYNGTAWTDIPANAQSATYNAQGYISSGSFSKWFCVSNIISNTISNQDVVVMITQPVVQFYNSRDEAQSIADAINDGERDATQDSVDQSEQDSQDSQDDVDQTTSSLLAVGSQVVGVITNTAASNCNITMNFAHFNVGVVNVCSNVPEEVLNIVRGVSALVFVPIIVNYAIYLVNKLVYLYRSFQE